MRKAEIIEKYGIEAYERQLGWNRQWYGKHPEKVKEKNKRYYQTPFGRASHLKKNYNKDDKKRGFDTTDNVTPEWIVANIFSGQKCIYCGETDWRKLGVDRIDNSKPHTADNLVCSCGECNVERKDKFTVEEFIKYKKEHPKRQSVDPSLPKSRIKTIKSTFVNLI